MWPHKNKLVHLENRLPKSNTHTSKYPQDHIDTHRNTHVDTCKRPQHAEIMNSAVQNGWAEETRAILFPSHWWTGQCALYTLFHSFSFPLSPSLSFSYPLFMQGKTLLSPFQLNWKHCTVSFPSSFHKKLPDLGSVSVSLFVFHLCPLPHNTTPPQFKTPKIPPTLSSLSGHRSWCSEQAGPKWREQRNQPLVPKRCTS